jgi:hypothetical protein
MTDHLHSPTSQPGDHDVYLPIHPNDMAQVAHDRIRDLYETAAELRATRRTARERAGLLMRTRWLLGRRLISIGSAVSGQHA